MAGRTRRSGSNSGGLKYLGYRLYLSQHPYTPDGGSSISQWIYNCNGQPTSCWETFLFPGPDLNPFDGPPVKQANGSWVGFGTIRPFQNNFPRIIKVSMKLFFRCDK